jgi:hypothetical protein
MNFTILPRVEGGWAYYSFFRVSCSSIDEDVSVDVSLAIPWGAVHIAIARAGHNFCCLLISLLFVNPLINRTALIFHFENVNLMEQCLF